MIPSLPPLPRFRARTALAAASGFAVAIVVGLAAPVAAAGDPVPFPHLRPAYKATAKTVAAGTGTAAATAAARPNVQPAIDPNSPFSPQQQVALASVTAYFNSFRTMEGRFIQIGPNGEQSEGVFFLQKPGRIRFHYNPPARLDVISDGSSVAIKDGRSGTQDLYPLSKTPLRYLLADHIDLTSPTLVNSVREEDDLITVIIVEKTALVQGTLTMTFDKKSFELRQWQVTDAQGLNTSVAIFDVALNKPQSDSNLYRINVN